MYLIKHFIISEMVHFQVHINVKRKPLLDRKFGCKPAIGKFMFNNTNAETFYFIFNQKLPREISFCQILTL